MRCVYCSEVVTNVRKGEHIIPDAIGGVRTIKNVCRKCNNEKLARLDEELCSRSPLATVASQELGERFGMVGYTWDVDHRAGDVLVEAQPVWPKNNMILWPQLLLQGDDLVLVGDQEEMRLTGHECFERMVHKHAKLAFQKYRVGEKGGLAFSRLDPDASLLRRYRYPPRVFCRRRILGFADNMTWLAGFSVEEDRRRILHALDKMNSVPAYGRREVQLGSHFPVVARSWEVVTILRALTKIGINLLVDTCTQTSLGPDTLGNTIGFVLGSREPRQSWLARCGFTWPADLQPIHRKDNGHAFRLMFVNGRWTIYSSFFGGRIAAVVDFPGPSTETWHTADVSTPLSSTVRDVTNEWSVTKHILVLPLRTHVEWSNPARIAPSLNLENTASTLRIQRLPARSA